MNKPGWAKKRGITDELWQEWLTWAKERYGWRSFLEQNEEGNFDEFLWVRKTRQAVQPITQPTEGAAGYLGDIAALAPSTAFGGTWVGGTWVWRVPGYVLYNATKNKYLFTGGENDITENPEGRYAEISPDQVDAVIKQYMPEVSPESSIWTTKNPETIMQNGWEWRKEVDQFGNVNWVPIGRTPSRDWGGEQLGLEREKFAWAKEQVARAQDPELQRATNELRWERDRIQLLSGLPSDDWISRYTLQNQPNPYKLSEENVHTSRMNQVATNLDQRTGEVQNLQNQLASAVTSGNTETAAKLEAELKNTTASRDYLYNLYNTMQKETMNWTPQPAPQPYPNAPEWLPLFAPGQVAGKMITPQNVPTPSGQQLTQMSPSRASQLGYYADWTRKMGAGRNWQDILGEAKLMQPYTPRGAGSFRTSPARQWV